jgi:hypothetical protein
MGLKTMPCSLISHSYEKRAILRMRLNGAVGTIVDPIVQYRECVNRNCPPGETEGLCKKEQFSEFAFRKMPSFRECRLDRPESSCLDSRRFE